MGEGVAASGGGDSGEEVAGLACVTITGGTKVSDAVSELGIFL